MNKEATPVNYAPYVFGAKLNGVSDKFIISIIMWKNAGEGFKFDELTLSDSKYLLKYSKVSGGDQNSWWSDHRIIDLDSATEIKIVCKESAGKIRTGRLDIFDDFLDKIGESDLPSNGAILNRPHLFLVPEPVVGGAKMHPFISIRSDSDPLPTDSFPDLQQTNGLAQINLATLVPTLDYHHHNFITSKQNKTYSTNIELDGFFLVDTRIGSSSFSKGKIKNKNSDGTGGN